MTLDWTHFTPATSLLGGVLLGLAASLFMLVCGRVLGISSIVGGLLRGVRGDRAWRYSFLLGLAASPWLYQAAGGVWEGRFESSTGLLIAAGLLVGVGTRWGSGCTSGHGVCGLSRLSWRSWVATLCFMASGVLTVALLRHVWA